MPIESDDCTQNEGYTTDGSKRKKNLRRLYAILSGGEDELSQTIVTIAFDSAGFDERWNKEFRLNELVDIMLSFM